MKSETLAAARLRVVRGLRDRRLQPLWEQVHAAALMGMNFGDGNETTNGELWLLDWLTERLGPSPVVFDVGANAGRYSQAVLGRIPEARLYSFEPSSAAFDKLTRALGSRGTQLRVALGADDAARPMYADQPGSELGSLIRRDLHRHGLGVSEIEAVIVRRLETVCDELNVDSIDLLKIDAEGSELDVLHGAGAMLGTRIGAIQFEFGGTAIDARQTLRDFFDLLEPCYCIHRLLPGALRPLNYSERCEIFEYANYVALPECSSSIVGHRTFARE